MSARVVGKTNHGDIITWKFCQDIPIPSYLIALVVGCLESRQVIGELRVYVIVSLYNYIDYKCAWSLKTLQWGYCMVISNSLQASRSSYFGVVWERDGWQGSLGILWGKHHFKYTMAVRDDTLMTQSDLHAQVTCSMFSLPLIQPFLNICSLPVFVSISSQLATGLQGHIWLLYHGLLYHVFYSDWEYAVHCWGDCGAICVGSIRPPGPASFLSVWWHGEPLSHLPHSNSFGTLSVMLLLWFYVLYLYFSCMHIMSAHKAGDKSLTSVSWYYN